MKSLYPLNCVDRYFLAHENENLHANCHYIIESDAHLSKSEIEGALITFYNSIPAVQSRISKGILGYTRYVTNRSIGLSPPSSSTLPNGIFSSIDSNTLGPIEVSELENKFFHQPFNLESGPPCRVLLVHLPEAKSRIVFSAHHSFADGVALYRLLEEFFLCVQGKEVRPYASKAVSVRYRSLIKKLGIRWFLGQVVLNLKNLKKRSRPIPATLIANPGTKDRTVGTHLLHWDKPQIEAIQKTARHRKMSLAEFVSYLAFKALDQTLAKYGDAEKPIMLLMTSNHRFHFKTVLSFQNVMGTLWLSFSRGKIRNTQFFDEFIKEYRAKHTFSETLKLPITSGLLSLLKTRTQLERYYRQMEADPNCIYATVIVSAGKFPDRSPIPAAWKISRIYGRVSLTKSPGLSFMLTSTRNYGTLCIQYLNALIPSEKIEYLATAFQSRLNEELGSSND